MDEGKQFAQRDADVQEILLAFEAGGMPLADRTFRAIVEARKLVMWESMRLRDRVFAAVRLLTHTPQ